MHYDHITFHLDEDYPSDLPAHNAVHHIGFYFAWAVSQNLHSAAVASLPEFDLLQQGLISGSVFVLNQLGGGIDETCFNELGNRFTAFYYHDDEDGYGNFLIDYFNALNLNDETDFYRTEDNPESQALVNPIFQAAFEHWRASLTI